jgi:hypothetical protein
MTWGDFESGWNSGDARTVCAPKEISHLRYRFRTFEVDIVTKGSNGTPPSPSRGMLKNV